MTSKDDDEGESIKVSSRKADKKTNRALAILKNDTGIIESNNPTSIIFVCNAGLVTGCSSSDLLSLFSKHGPVMQVILIPKKSYSFVIFKEEISAKAAFDEIHAKVGFTDKGPLYLAFVDHAPDYDDPWKETKLPPGLTVVPNFVTEAEESEILSLFNWDESTKETVLKHRQVKHYGFEFNYSTNDIDPDDPLEEKVPPECLKVAEKAVSEGLMDVVADQMTVNRYLPGQGIPPHVDNHNCATQTILSLSLVSGVTMVFKSVETGKQVLVWLPARSLLVMSGEARYSWSHGITPRHYDTLPCSHLGLDQDGLTLVHRDIRVSLTFRKTFHGTYCDKNKFDKKEITSHEKTIEETASLLEKQLVHSVYEEIAGHFSDTRHKPWPKVAQFIQNLPKHELLLDLGCGNGKYLGLDGAGCWQIGTDYSYNLLQISRSRGHEGVRCDLLSIPFKDGAVGGGVICIAVLHHLASHSRRLEALKEIARILSPGARGLIYVWAREQNKDDAMSSYLKQNKKNFKSKKCDEKEVSNRLGEFGLPVHVNRTQFQHQDVLVPWKTKSQNKEEDKEWKRFYHVFEEGELESLIAEVDQLKLVESYYDQGNWCCSFQKN